MKVMKELGDRGKKPKAGDQNICHIMVSQKTLNHTDHVCSQFV